MRVRTARADAVEATQRRLRETTLTLLQELGAEAAREHLASYLGPFHGETEGTRANLLAYIEDWEHREKSQREEELHAAERAFSVLLGDITPHVISRDWSLAVGTVDTAATRPALFPVAEQVADLRRELSSLQNVPREILDQYRERLNQETNLMLRGGAQVLRIRDVIPEGIVTSKPIYSPDGTERGTVEQTIPFSLLSYREILLRMEPLTESHHDIYRGLLAHQNGFGEAARFYFQAADSALARAIQRELYGSPDPAPPLLPDPISAPEVSPEDLDFNTPRFDPEATPGFP